MNTYTSRVRNPAAKSRGRVTRSENAVNPNQPTAEQCPVSKKETESDVSRPTLIADAVRGYSFVVGESAYVPIRRDRAARRLVHFGAHVIDEDTVGMRESKVGRKGSLGRSSSNCQG